MTSVKSKRCVEAISGKFICAECNMSFRHNTALLQHLKNFHPSQSQTSLSVPAETDITERSVKSIPEKLIGSKCSKRCQTEKSSIQRLRRSVINCPKSVSVQTGSVQRCAESVSKKFTCSECDKSYQHKTELQQHMRESHLKKSRISVSERIETAERCIELASRKFICLECDISYQHKGELQHHMRKLHRKKSCISVSERIETAERCIELASEKFICSECDKTYQYKDELQQHMRKTHLKKSCISTSVSKKIETAEKCIELVPEKFTCSECDKSYQHKDELQQHMKKTHLKKSCISTSVSKKIETAERCIELVPGKFICSECDKSYQHNCELQQHMKEMHLTKSEISVPVPAKIETTEKREGLGKFICSECGKSYRHNRTLRHHMRKFHPSKFQPSCARKVAKKKKIYKRDVLCSLCQQNVDKKSYESHCEKEHNMIIETEELHFATFDDFTYWKENLENATHATYVKNRGDKPDKRGNMNISLQCHRSGYYVKKGEGQRLSKKLGSCKINGYCPAGMRLLKAKDNECHVIFTKTHVGHENEISHKQLSLSERQLIASKLASQISPDAILNEIKDSVSGSQLERIHLLTRKDLHNIKRSFKINVPTVRLSRKRKKDERHSSECDDESLEDCAPNTDFSEFDHEGYRRTSLLVERKKVEIKKNLGRLVDGAESVQDIQTLEMLVDLVQPTLKAVREKSLGKMPSFQLLMTFSND